MTNETNELETLMTELKNVVENSEDLTYDEVVNEISTAYKAAGIAATESKEKEAEEIKTLLKQLNELAASKKKKNVKTKSLKEMEKTEKLEAESPAEAEVKTAKSTIDVSPTEQIAKREIPRPVVEPDEVEAKTEDENSVGVEHVPAEEPKEEKVIPAPAAEEKPKAKPQIEIDQPEVEKENIIVQPVHDANAEEKPVEDDDSDKLYSDLEDIFTPKPFDGDDDIDLDSIPLEEAPKPMNVQTKAEVEAERIKKVDEEYGNLPEDIQLLGVKSISRKKVSDTLKALAGLDTSNIDVKHLEMFDFDVNDQSIRRDYLKTRNDMIAAPKISRIGLLMSGHYEEVAAYGNHDMISVERNLYSPSLKYPDKERLLLESIYSHINYVSYAKEKPSFDDWCKSIYYPDYQSLFFGVYDANSVGKNRYTFDCPYCGTEVSVTRTNAELSVGVPKELSKDDLEKFITNKDIMSVDSSKLTKWAKETTIRKMLPNSKILVVFSVPTLFDYLTTLFTLEKINVRDLGGQLDLSILDGFSGDTADEQEQQIEDFNRIMACLYVKQIGIPTRVGDTNKFRYIGITNKADIIEHINGLDEDDYAELLRGDSVRDLITKTATRYYLRDCKCESCDHNIKYVSINPKQIFFFKIGEGRAKRMS